MCDENKCVVLKPREMTLSTPAPEKILSAHHASYSARVEIKPWPQVLGSLPVSAYLAFCLTVRVRRDMIENGRKFTNIRVHVRLPVGEWGISRGVTQAGMPRGNINGRHPEVLVA